MSADHQSAMPAAARPLQRLSPKTDRAYDFIVARIEAGRPFPSLQEISDYLGCPKDKAGTLDILHRLKMRGQIRIRSRTRPPGARGWAFEWELLDRASAAAKTSVQDGAA